MPQTRLLAGTLLAMLFSMTVCAQTSSTDVVDHPVRWQSLTSGPLWISMDTRPRLDKKSGFHPVKLSPGQRVIVQLPSRSALRLRSMDDQLSPNDLVVFVSDGDSLYIDTPLIESTEKQSLVLPADRGERLVQIERPLYAQTPAHIALFWSSEETYGTVSRRSEPVALGGGAVEIKRENDVTAQSFWPVDGGQGLSFEVEGPVRLSMQSRIRYPAGTEKLSGLMHVETWLGATPIERTPYIVGMERSGAVFVNGCAEVTGRLQRHFYDVPQGKHVVSFIPDFPVYARVTVQKNDDFLLPRLNRFSIPLDDSEATYSNRLIQLNIVRDIDLIGQNNSFSDSGLAAAAKTQQVMQEYSANDEVVSLGRHLISRYTTYRNVVPQNISTQEISMAWPKTRSLVNIEREEFPLIVNSEHKGAMLSNLSRAQFVKLNKQSVNDYRIPPRQYPTTLRLLVKRPKNDNEIRFRVQLGKQDARELRLTADPMPPMSRYRPPVSHAGVMAAQLSQYNYQSRPNTNYFIEGDRSGDIVDVAMAEFELPPDIEQVTVFDASAKLDIAIQHRANKSYRIDEVERINISQAMDEDKLLHNFTQFITRPQGAIDVTKTDKQSQIENHWVPLRRLLYANARRYKQSVASMEDWEKFIRSGKSPTDAAKIVRNARQSESRQDWLSALEVWANGRNSDIKENRHQALIGQALALEALGESFLSQRLLRSIFYHEDQALPDSQTFQLLLERTRDDASKLSLLSAAAMRQPNIDLLVQLVEALIENGEYQSALDLGLVIPLKLRPLESLLRAAYVQRDWRTLEYLLSTANDKELIAYWRGYRAQQQRNYDQAVQLWSQAGDRGKSLAEFLHAGVAIHDTLGLDDHALTAWQQWQAHHPGTHRWVRDETLIKQSAGAVTTYAVERNLYGRMYRSTPRQPGVLKAHGPARLRISARLEYSRKSEELQDDWLIIREGNKTHHIVINNDSPVPGLRIVNAENTQVGRSSKFELYLGPGEHEIRLSARNTPLLFNVDVLRPELPLNVLPPITTNAVESFSNRPDNKLPQELDRIRFVQDCNLVSGSELIKTHRRNINIDNSRIKVSEWLASTRGTPVWQQGTSQSQAVTELNELIWQAEQNKEKWTEYLARGERLFQQNLTNKELNPLISRLRRLTSAQWRPLTNIEQDAGVHILDIEGWQPESLALRIRKALMGPVWDGERVVTGGAQLGLSLFNSGTTDLDLTLTSLDIPFLPRSPVSVHYTVDNSARDSVRLSTQDSKRNVTVNMPDGTHTLRVGIVQAFANQYVKLSVRQGGQVLAEPSRRVYHVATNDVPVQVLVNGPAWLRIDENRAGRAHYQYMFVDPGWQRVVLKPPAGRDEALYRIHQRLPGGSRTIAPPVTQVELAQVPNAPFELFASPSDSLVAVDENLEPDLSGTWGTHLSLNSRRNFEEDLVEAGEQDEFFEARGEYRMFNRDDTLHHRSLVLGRLRSDGGSTLGVAHRVVFDNGIWPYRLQFNGGVFGQDIESESSSFETSINLSASASRLFEISPDSDVIPRLRVFWRSLSLDEFPDTSDQIDQDVFTRYKSDHESGLTLSGLYLHRPWQDTQWVAGAGVTTNELSNASEIDYYQLRAGWRQLVSAGVLDGEFRVRRYLDDDDRAESVTRPSLRVKLDVEKWQLDRSRWQLSFSFNRDFESQDNSIRLELDRIFSRHRGFRDFRLGETRFRRLREERYRQLYQ